MCKKLLCMISFMLILHSPALACYSIVAGKAATTDGSVLFGHNEDNSRKFVAGMWKVERKYHGTDKWVQLKSGYRIPQVETTWMAGFACQRETLGCSPCPG